MNEEQLKNVGRALGQIPSGGSILTARQGERSTGMLASWVQQASFEPPSITVAVRHGRPVQELIEASGHFLLNLIGEDRGPMFRHFSKGFGPGEPAFEGLNRRDEPEGVILKDCIAYMKCRVLDKLNAGDHTIYVGEIIEAGSEGQTKPYVHLRSNGLKY
jgi:flavin reductase (DIM6/NTAB) family NADH-FMN oxidoreductase RutF